MKLWQKDKASLKEVEQFTVGNDREFDLLLAPFDVLGSIAHVIMLESVGLLEKEERKPVKFILAPRFLYGPFGTKKAIQIPPIIDNADEI